MDVPNGWFADESDDAPDHRTWWQPFLQTDGACIPLRIWFLSEQECKDWILQHLIGQTLLP